MNTLPPRFLRNPILRLALLFTRPRMYLLTLALQIWLVANSSYVAFGMVTLFDIVQKIFWRTIENLRTTWRLQLTGHDQVLMNSRADAYLRRLNSGESCEEERPVFLFLRSFAMDKLLEVDPADSRRKPIMDPFHDDPFARDLRKVAIETAMAHDLNERGTTIALRNADEIYSLGGDAWVADRDTGNTLFFLGPGEVLLDPGAWFEQFARAADHCDLIVSIPIIYCTGPPEQNGTLRELRYVVENGLLDKCIFVMPPEQYFEAYGVFRPFGRGKASESVRVDKHVSQLWNESLPLLESIGLTLPNYTATDRSVGLFNVGSERVIRFSVSDFRFGFVLTALRILREAKRSDSTMDGSSASGRGRSSSGPRDG